MTNSTVSYDNLVSISYPFTNFELISNEIANVSEVANGFTEENASEDNLIGGHTIGQVIAIVIVAVTLMFFTVAGNLLVIISYKTNRQLRTINNMFLVSLACSDLVIGIVSMNLYPIYMISRRWWFGPVLCDIWLCIDYTLSMASVANLLLICVDRYLSVTRPFTYRSDRTKKKTTIFIATAWTFSFLLWAPAIVIWPLKSGRTVPPTDCYIQFLYENETITVVTAILAFYLPVLVMCVLYGFIYRETRKCSQYLEYLKSYGKSRPSTLASPFLSLRRSLQLRANSSCPSPNLNSKSSDNESNGQRPRFLSLSATDSRQEGEIHIGFRKSTSDAVSCNHHTRSNSFASRVSASPPFNKDLTQKPIPISTSGSEDVFCDNSSCGDKRPKRIKTPRIFFQKLTKKISFGSTKTFPDQNTAPRQHETDVEKPLILGKIFHATPNRGEPAALGSLLGNEGQSRSKALPNEILESSLCNSRKSVSDTKKRIKMPSSEKKAGRTLSAILLAFVLTWLPYNICAVYKTFCTSHDCIPPPVWDAAYYLCYINSTVNPFCFALCNKTFRETFKKLLTCKKRGGSDKDLPPRLKRRKNGKFSFFNHMSSSSSARNP